VEFDVERQGLVDLGGLDAATALVEIKELLHHRLEIKLLAANADGIAAIHRSHGNLRAVALAQRERVETGGDQPLGRMELKAALEPYSAKGKVDLLEVGCVPVRPNNRRKGP